MKQEGFSEKPVLVLRSLGDSPNGVKKSAVWHLVEDWPLNMKLWTESIDFCKCVASLKSFE